MERLEVQATKENLLEVAAFVEGYLEQLDCSMKSMMQISVAVEEIYINIASYAYEDGPGMAEIELEHNDAEGAVDITFKDSGIPYNPLEKEDPDVTLSAEERAIGGLGIYMVKKSMDDMKYKYEDGKNILTITKKL